MPTYSENFIQIRLEVFAHTGQQTDKWQRKHSLLGGGNDETHIHTQNTTFQWPFSRWIYVSRLIDWVNVLRPIQHKIGHFGDVTQANLFPKPISWLRMEKQNLTQQKPAITNQKKCTTTQNKHKKLKPGLVASYDIWPRNGEGRFLFLCFITLSLTYLNTYPLNYSPDLHGQVSRLTLWFSSTSCIKHFVVIGTGFFQAGWSSRLTNEQSQSSGGNSNWRNKNVWRTKKQYNISFSFEDWQQCHVKLTAMILAANNC